MKAGKIEIKSFQDLINIAKKENEVELKYDLERNVKLVSFVPGKINITFNEKLNKNFIKMLTEKLLKWTGISLLVIIILLILVPILFKDQIKQLVIDEVNKTLTAELQLDDFDLTFISTFPNMTILNQKLIILLMILDISDVMFHVKDQKYLLKQLNI